MRKLFLTMYATCCICCICNMSACNDAWEKHWISGLELNEKNEYALAEEQYTIAVDMIKNEINDDHIFIRSSRAKNYLQQELFYKALEDVYLVIDCPSLSTKDLIDALEIRMRAYAGLGMIDKFNEDFLWYQSLNPYMPKIEMTEKYVIIRNCEMMHEGANNDIVNGLFVAAGFCEDVSKIKKIDNVIIIERIPHACSCECIHNEDSKKLGTFWNMIPHPGGPVGAHNPDVMKEQLRKQVEGCKAYCDNSANTAIAISARLIALNPAFVGALITIQVCREKCKECCQENGGFYKNCIQPIVDYYHEMQNKINKILDGKRPMGFPRRG